MAIYGNMEGWDNCSRLAKTYVALLKPETIEVMEGVQVARNLGADELPATMQRDNARTSRSSTARTAGPPQQHLRLNVKSVSDYDTVRHVIAKYHQSRCITRFRTVDAGGPGPMDV